ncbi:hypothetical protein [Neolewinella persica]|uniref:hypothetical protein n=1 Tax=Neolewinella persica TaxID=70998 RepID=UPI000376B6F7|nr:hypothetical protein [Neolewinella persica]
MKNAGFLPIIFLLFAPFFLQAQDFLGSWTMSGTTPEGQTITNTIAFNADGTMTVDFGNDGKVDVNATYTHKGNQISVSDTSKESDCYGKLGVYSVTVSGDTFTAVLVSDPCDARRADKMVMTRK